MIRIAITEMLSPGLCRFRSAHWARRGLLLGAQGLPAGMSREGAQTPESCPTPNLLAQSLVVSIAHNFLAANAHVQPRVSRSKFAPLGAMILKLGVVEYFDFIFPDLIQASGGSGLLFSCIKWPGTTGWTLALCCPSRGSPNDQNFDRDCMLRYGAQQNGAGCAQINGAGD